MESAARAGRRHALLGAAAAVASAPLSRAQDQPPTGGRAIRVVVPSAPGAFDTYARIMAPPRRWTRPAGSRR